MALHGSTSVLRKSPKYSSLNYRYYSFKQFQDHTEESFSEGYLEVQRKHTCANTLNLGQSYFCQPFSQSQDFQCAV